MASEKLSEILGDRDVALAAAAALSNLDVSCFVRAMVALQTIGVTPPASVAPAPLPPPPAPVEPAPPSTGFVRAWTTVESDAIKKRAEARDPNYSPPMATVHPTGTPQTDDEEEGEAVVPPPPKPAPPSSAASSAAAAPPKERMHKSAAKTVHPVVFEPTIAARKHQRWSLNVADMIKWMKKDNWKKLAHALESEKAGQWRSDRNVSVSWAVVAYRALMYGRLTGSVSLATEASRQLYFLNDDDKSCDRRVHLGDEPDRVPLANFDEWWQAPPSGLSAEDKEIWERVDKEETDAFLDSWEDGVKARFVRVCKREQPAAPEDERPKKQFKK